MAENINDTEEYEYIELAEGEEIPEGYEYEYVEVPEDSVAETVVAVVEPIVATSIVKEPEKMEAEVSLDDILGDVVAPDDIKLDGFLFDENLQEPKLDDDFFEKELFGAQPVDLGVSFDSLFEDKKEPSLSPMIEAHENVNEPFFEKEVVFEEKIEELNQEMKMPEPAEEKIEPEMLAETFVEPSVESVTEPVVEEKIFQSDVLEIEAIQEDEPEAETIVEVLKEPEPELASEPEVQAEVLVLPKVLNINAKDYALATQDMFKVNKNMRLAKVVGKECEGRVALENIDFDKDELSDWNLIVFAKKIYPLSTEEGQVFIEKQDNVVRYSSVVKKGQQKLDVFDEKKMGFLTPDDKFNYVQGNFICGDLGCDSGLLIDDYINISIKDYAGSSIGFGEKFSGILCGPKGAFIYLFEMKEIYIPKDVKNVLADNFEALQNAKWYSGKAEDQYFEINLETKSGNFVGTSEIHAIHVNVGNSTYGWNISFDEGLTMSLQDLKEYQIRFAKMPSKNGTIIHGDQHLKFSNIDKIVIYQSAQYLCYSLPK